MKKIGNILFMLATLPFLFACDGMMDFHKNYLEDGEIVYLPRPVSVDFLAGRDRVLLRIELYNSPNVKTVDVFWNNGRDSIIVPVSPSTGLDTILINIPNLEEGSYTFTAWTTDAYGNHSLPTTGFSGSYGDMYQLSLSNQTVWQIFLTEDGGQVTWTTTLDNLLRTEIRYLNKSGDSVTVKTAAGVAADLPGALAGSTFKYRSVFIPEEFAIDTFYSAWAEYKNQFPDMILADKSAFRILTISDEKASDGGGKNMIIDNKLDTYWHSQWSPDAPFPHWLIMDLGRSRDIVRIEVYRRTNTTFTDTKTVQFKVSDESEYGAASWKNIGQVVFSNVKGEDMQTLDVTPGTNAAGQYLQLFLPDNNGRSTYVAISEIYIYVK